MVLDGFLWLFDLMKFAMPIVLYRGLQQQIPFYVAYAGIVQNPLSPKFIQEIRRIFTGTAKPCYRSIVGRSENTTDM